VAGWDDDLHSGNGGYVIVDDYGNVAGCRQAVHDFRAQRGINDPIRPIDWAGVYSRRSGDGARSRHIPGQNLSE
jgi:hypothetical protein